MEDLLICLIIASVEEYMGTRGFHRDGALRLIIAAVVRGDVLVIVRSRVLLLKILLLLRKI